jgi:hypothetical protein
MITGPGSRRGPGQPLARPVMQTPRRLAPGEKTALTRDPGQCRRAARHISQDEPETQQGEDLSPSPAAP